MRTFLLVLSVTALCLAASASPSFAINPWLRTGIGPQDYWLAPQGMWMQQLNNFAAQEQLNAEQAQTESNMHYATPYSLPAGTPNYPSPYYGDLNTTNRFGELAR